MAKLNTVKRVEVTLILDADEAQALSDHLGNTTDEKSNNIVLSIAQSLDYAINGRPKLTDEEKAAKAQLKAAKQASKDAKAAARPGTDAPKAPAAPANGEPKKKVTVPAN